MPRMSYRRRETTGVSLADYYSSRKPRGWWRLARSSSFCCGRFRGIKINPHVFRCALELPLVALWSVNLKCVCGNPTDVVLSILPKAWMPGNIRRHDNHLNEAHPSHPVAELSKLCVVALDELLVGPAGIATLELNRDETAVGHGCNPSTKYPLLDGPSVVYDEENNERRRKAPAYN